MRKFDNRNGTYTISHPIAISLILALESEQRDKNFIYAMNENQITHVKQIKKAASFAGHITEEFTKNVSRHIIQKLNSPVEDSKKKIEDFTKTALSKLEEHERCLEGQRDHRLSRGFLSRTREEREAELLEAKITVLSEGNENLKSHTPNLPGLTARPKNKSPNF
jgi:hypothetical protein